MENKKISVVVRTYKRTSVLRECITELMEQTLPSGEFEILVIDNDPSGSAKEIVEEASFPKKSIFIKYFVVPVQSASRTANKGIQESQGDIVAFIDDDAIPAENWLEEIRRSFEKDDVKIAGGKILLCQEEFLPGWVNEPIKKMLGKLDIGKTFRKMSNKEFPLLMNFAARREVFEKVGLFPEKLGYQERKPLGGEETAFAIAAGKKGYDVYYNPAMAVYHQIQHKKSKRLFFIKKKFWEGRAVFITNRMFYPLFCVVFVFFFRCFVAVPLLTVLFLVSFLDRKKKYTMILLCKIFRNLGYGVQAFM